MRRPAERRRERTKEAVEAAARVPARWGRRVRERRSWEIEALAEGERERKWDCDEVAEAKEAGFEVEV